MATVFPGSEFLVDNALSETICNHASWGDEYVARGLFIRDDGSIIVEYGARKIAIPRAQYRANGYKPPLEKLPNREKSVVGDKNGERDTRLYRNS